MLSLCQHSQKLNLLRTQKAVGIAVQSEQVQRKKVDIERREREERRK